MLIQVDAPTAKVPMLTAKTAGMNVETAARPGPADRYRAGVCMWLVRGYMRDLEAFFAGDSARFNRMVVEGGKGLPNAHPHGWAQLALRNMAEPNVAELFGDEVTQYRQRLSEWKLA